MTIIYSALENINLLVLQYKCHNDTVSVRITNVRFTVV